LVLLVALIHLEVWRSWFIESEFQLNLGRKVKNSAVCLFYQLQGNPFLKREHLKISKQCRIHGKCPDQRNYVLDEIISYNAKVLNDDELAGRYIPKSKD
jgi:hypothetical protein